MKGHITLRQSEHGVGARLEPVLDMPAGQLVFQAGLPLAVLLALAVWSVTAAWFPVPAAPPAAIVVLAALTLASTLFVRWFQRRFRVERAAVRALPDPLFALYLATVILVGAPSAVLLSMASALVSRAPDVLRQPRMALDTLRVTAGTAATTFVAGIAYVSASHVWLSRLSPLHRHFLGAVLASCVMVLGISAVRALDECALGQSLGNAWIAYLKSPTLRFQALLLSVGPLLPVAEVLDDVEAEFAWMLFLVPLFAVYYLALVTVRLQQRSDELQITVGQLRVARRREAELTDYAALVTRAQEDERRRLARELHDDTAQALIALSRGLDTLSSRHVEPPLSSYDSKFISGLGDLATRTLDSVRRACQDLRPSVLDDLGLAAALESLAHSITQRGLVCTFCCEGESRPCAPEVEVTIYRIAQEALSNARQHAHATEGTLSIAYHPERISLEVHDNGVGFDYDHLLRSHSELSRAEQESRPGLGLMGMRERASLIGAKLQVHSEPGAGTTITLEVPLNGAPAGAQR